MVTETLGNVALTSDWEDAIVTLAGAESVDVLIQNLGPGSAAIWFGGGSAPAPEIGGILLYPGDSVQGNAANIWMKSPGNLTDVSVNLL